MSGQNVRTGTTGLSRWAGASDKGHQRAVNEDAYLVVEDQELFAVADGCGGREMADSALGSLAAWAATRDGPLPGMDTLAAAISRANQEAYQLGQADPRLAGQGCTLACMALSPGWVRVGHVGDCRIMRLRNGELVALTVDHRLPMLLAASGARDARSQELARSLPNVVTRALGTQARVAIDTAYHPTESGDLVLVCSDGLTDALDQQELQAILSSVPCPLERCCEDLLAAAERAGSTDNVTLIVVELI